MGCPSSRSTVALASVVGKVGMLSCSFESSVMTLGGSTSGLQGNARFSSVLDSVSATNLTLVVSLILWAMMRGLLQMQFSQQCQHKLCAHDPMRSAR